MPKIFPAKEREHEIARRDLVSKDQLVEKFAEVDKLERQETLRNSLHE